jgi:hypothetical protein
MQLVIWIDDEVKRSDDEETGILMEIGDFVRENYAHPFDPANRLRLEFEVTEG